MRTLIHKKVMFKWCFFTHKDNLRSSRSCLVCNFFFPQPRPVESRRFAVRSKPNSRFLSRKRRLGARDHIIHGYHAIFKCIMHARERPAEGERNDGRYERKEEERAGRDMQAEVIRSSLQGTRRSRQEGCRRGRENERRVF